MMFQKHCSLWQVLCSFWICCWKFGVFFWIFEFKYSWRIQLSTFDMLCICMYNRWINKLNALICSSKRIESICCGYVRVAELPQREIQSQLLSMVGSHGWAVGSTYVLCLPTLQVAALEGEYSLLVQWLAFDISVWLWSFGNRANVYIPSHVSFVLFFRLCHRTS